MLPADASLVTDSGFAEIILPTNVGFSSGQRCIHPVSQGAMGFALPAIVGVHFSGDHPIVAVVGDGSVMMNLQELQTIRHHNIPAKILIISNNAYAIIRRRQTDLFRSRTIGTDSSNGVSCPDFREVAKSFALPYARIERADELEPRLRDVLMADGAIICEILGLENQDYIETSLARNSAGRLVRRPLEDQAPFLDRTTFLAEMIVEPIDQ
jgi:acetolactate synthase-1/2/3 large subunit